MTSGLVTAATVQHAVRDLAAPLTPAPTSAPAPDRTSPTAALEARFATIWREHMQDVPMVNPALQVQAVGMAHWQHHWLGVLVTPWFMNLVLLPRVVAHWHPIGERETRHYVFPAGVFEFIGSKDAVLGDYQACSLFSPMFEFADHEAAVATASSALAALFDAGNRPAPEVHPAQAVATQAGAPGAAAAGTAAAASSAATASAAAPTSALSKRDFLFGSKARADRGT
jgi:[NiFe] hydrogenase assembly HybE family chaperone